MTAFGTGFASSALGNNWITNSLYVMAFSSLQNGLNQLIWNGGTHNYNFGNVFTAGALAGMSNAATFGASKYLDLNWFPGAGTMFTTILGGTGEAPISGIPRPCNSSGDVTFTYQESETGNTLYYCH